MTELCLGVKTSRNSYRLRILLIFGRDQKFIMLKSTQKQDKTSIIRDRGLVAPHTLQAASHLRMLEI